MRPTLWLILVAAVALDGCAHLGKSALPICDGRHRRPANLNGSVLDPAAPASAALSSPKATAPHPSCRP
jgi:type IV secretion system protein VirB7